MTCMVLHRYVQAPFGECSCCRIHRNVAAPPNYQQHNNFRVAQPKRLPKPPVAFTTVEDFLASMEQFSISSSSSIIKSATANTTAVATTAAAATTATATATTEQTLPALTPSAEERAIIFHIILKLNY